ncbi:bifunctional metallophosphatase/5'-nucleotidase [Streptomyces calidiresistens]|uniref:Bifunctional metallophosphatase/5'-nucleotidase n=1 Tax=Streptomyces calidiresistens TaxID=1485586 RepID=A0A7W3T1F9_9ACTN|nr:bifunctional metallophosphatase/5'-nucleotidase [Streptomyces calidiresistens]MBB0229182.1 bifunctional metallophosphatase/5'-nucleotidase [Streptomyces calidiresistens]
MSGSPPTPRRRRRATATLAVGLVGALALSLPAAQAVAGGPGKGHPGKPEKPAKPGHTVELQVLALNDFHGALEPPTGSGGLVTHEHDHGGHETIEAGGVEYLATALREAREGRDRSVTVAAGDMVGATPLLSALFNDEPTIEALNLLGMDVVGVGNHEFDSGWEELIRLQEGGCHPVDGCYDEGREFEGADFPFLAANVVHEDTGVPILPPYSIHNMKGAKVGFIGVTLEGTANIVTRAGIEGIEFLDEAETINKYTRELKRKGVNAVIALIHEGGYAPSPAHNHDCDAAGGLSGPIVGIAEKTDPAVDVLITGHTHRPYVCTIPDPAGNDRLVTSAQSNGVLFTELTMEYDRKKKDIVRASVEGTNRVVHRERERASDLTALLDYWRDLAGAVASRPIGWIAEDITQDRNIPESPLGNLIADAQLAHARGVDPTATIALMNPGGIRTDLVYAASGDEGDGVVTYGEGFAVQPFSNYVVLLDLTGEQVLRVLREQVSGPNLTANKILQPSEGFSYTLDLTREGADRIVADSVTVHGEPLDPSATYRIAVNSFLAGGGDGFPTLAEGTDVVYGGLDLDALIDHLGAISSPESPLTAPAADRITVIR